MQQSQARELLFFRSLERSNLAIKNNLWKWETHNAGNNPLLPTEKKTIKKTKTELEKKCNLGFGFEREDNCGVFKF